MKTVDERLEEDAEGEDEKWSAEEESEGADKDDEPTVEESWLPGHFNSGRRLLGSGMMWLDAKWRGSQLGDLAEQYTRNVLHAKG